MASIIAGKTVGVATNAHVVCLDVIKIIGLTVGFDLQDLTAAVSYVLSQSRTGFEVASFSLETNNADPGVDAQVQRLIAAGIPVIAAAGNAPQGGIAQDASNVSPARVPEVITVGNFRANAPGDAWNITSNYGSVVDVLGVGTSVLAAQNGGGTVIFPDGTSQACAEVAGVAINYLEGNPSATPATVQGALVGAATTASVSGLPPNTTNKVVFTDFMPPIYSSQSVQRLGVLGRYQGQANDGMASISQRFLPNKGDTEPSHFIGGYNNYTFFNICLPARSFWSYYGYIARVGSSGTVNWLTSIAPPYTVCGTTVGGSDVISVMTAANGDVWALVRDVQAIQNSPYQTRLMLLDGSTGAIKSTIQVGTTGNNQPVALAGPDVSGNFYAVGTVTGADSYWTGPTGGIDISVARYDINGVKLSGWRFGTSLTDFATSATLSGTSVVIGGGTYGAFSGFTAQGGQDAIVMSVSTSGQSVVFQRGTSGDESVQGVTKVVNHIGAVGNTNGPLEANIYGATGGGDGFVWVLDSGPFTKFFGTLVGSTAYDAMAAITSYTLDNQEYMVFGGYTYGSQWAQNPQGGRDAVLFKISADGASQQPQEVRWAWQSGSAGDDQLSAVDVETPDTTAAQPGFIQFVGTTSGAFPSPTTGLGLSDGFRVRMVAF